MGVPPTVVHAHGPLAVEREISARLGLERESVRANPRLLASPLVVVTPSDGLRLHVAGLAARTVGALAGVRFVTIARLAHETLASLGAEPARGGEVADILVERAARAGFPGVDERFGTAAAASITDLLDAGLETGSAAAVLEALADGADRPPLSKSARDAATTIVRAAIAARAALDAAGACRDADVLARATEALRGAHDALRARAIWIHGFSDATGVQADFLAALVAARPTTIYWDDSATAARYGAALRARFGIADAQSSAIAAPVVATFRTRGVEAEAREALRRIRRLLDGGLAPERIALVARRIEPYAAAIRTHAERLAIPISGEGGRGPTSALGRRIRARLELFLDPRAAALDRWFAAHEQPAPNGLALLVGLRAMGAARLADLAELDVAAILGERAALRLPIRVARADEGRRDDGDPDEAADGNFGSEPEESAEPAEVEDAAMRDDDRKLDRRAIEAAVRAARSFAALAVDPRAEAPADVHGARIVELARRLGALDEDALITAARDLAAQLGPTFRLSAREFHEALARRVEALGYEPLGGQGGGVLVADAATARHRGFERIFVLGLNAGVFPASAREDPLLADEARARLAACLPDLALKRARGEEEVAIFSQLLAGSREPTLSWLVADADDEVLAPSPLLDAAGIGHPERVAIERGPIEPADAVAQPLVEHAQLAARLGTPAEAEAVLALALDAARRAHGLDPALAPRVAAARRATRSEIDRPPGRPEPLGPFFGAVGGARTAEREARKIAVTTIENVARCPWQAFLQRVLKIQAPLDPLLSAPKLDTRAVGSVAHALLAETAPARARDVELSEIEESTGATPHWPTSEVLHAKALTHTARILRDEGRYAAGLDALVAARALELVAVARRLDEAESDLRVLGAEVRAVVPIPGGRYIQFRADRVECVQKRLRLTDWKSGKVFGDQARASTRMSHHLKAIRAGTQLQAFVYAQVGGVGRYVALHPKMKSDDRREFLVTSDDADAGTAYEQALSTLLSAWDGGAFFPRLVGPDVHAENKACAQCEVSAACVRGDSGARLRFAALLLRTDEPPSDSHEALVRRDRALQTPVATPKSESDGDAAPPAARATKPRKTNKKSEEAT